MKEIRWTRALGLGLLTHAAVRICAARGIDAIRVRYLWQLLQPFDPLRSKGQAGLPEIDVLVPAHPKDVRVLKYCIAAVRGGSANRIRRISVIVPDDAVDSVRAELPAGCEVKPESEVLGLLAPWIRDAVPTEWRGWVIQQSIKLLWSMQNRDVATLIVDADTILLRPRTWLDAHGRQLLCISAERHPEYVEHARRLWSLTPDAQAVSYVTHHQLMQAKYLSEMFPDAVESVRRWIEAADFSQPSALSEYHSYGAWMRTFHADVVACARFGNRGRDLDELPDVTSDLEAGITALAERYPDRASLSFHSWKADL